MRKIQEYSKADLENFNKKVEGLNLTIDKDVLGDQKTLEVSTNVSDKAKVGKDDKEEFENYKVLYKGAIDDKCLEDYGTCDDNKLWEDIAKEMFLQSKTYVPEEDKKSDGELDKKTESKKLNENIDDEPIFDKNLSIENEDGDTIMSFKISNDGQLYGFENCNIADYEDNNIRIQQIGVYGYELDESKKLNEEFDEDELSEIYSYLSQMQALANNIDEYWTDFPVETREKLDSLFNENGSIGYCLRWLLQALDDLIGDWETTKKDLNELDENKPVKTDTSKECSKQVEEKECSKQN